MGFYENTGNGGKLLAGRGKAEYGASTVRTGSFNIQMNITDSTYDLDVTFSTPMPDNDYIVDLVCHNQHGSVCILNGTKTANGFTARASCVDSTAVGETMLVSYTAFKLYTDTEYNGLIAKNLGTSVDITSYTTESNKYTFTADGYVYLNGSTLSSGHVYVRIYGANASNSFYANMNITEQHQTMPVFVKKGMKCLVAEISTGATATYIPLE